jgi:hypothetical protein
LRDAGRHFRAYFGRDVKPRLDQTLALGLAPSADVGPQDRIGWAVGAWTFLDLVHEAGRRRVAWRAFVVSIMIHWVSSLIWLL